MEVENLGSTQVNTETPSNESTRKNKTTDAETTGSNQGSSFTQLELSLENRIKAQKAKELSRDGQELINFRLISNSMDNPEESSALSSKPGMKAVLISRPESNPTNVNVQLLQVSPDGNTTTLYSGNSVGKIMPDTGERDLGLRGGATDTRV